MDFENLDLRELAHLRSILFFPRNRLQINRQLAEMVIVRVTVDPDAAPGNREMRLATKTGMTKRRLAHDKTRCISWIWIISIIACFKVA